MKHILSAMLLALLAACQSAPTQPMTSPASAVAYPEVTIPQGLLKGSDLGGAEQFLNIPYAAAPTGALRWQPPADPEVWEGVRDATRAGPACIQPVRPALAAGGVADNQSEDCLQLNIWRPEGAESLPVMVWIHGGAHVLGSGIFPVFDGEALARQGVVVVTINYRLGVFGYFAHPSLTAEAGADAPIGNYGLMDQLAALKWVQENIAAFGGDPSRVTAFGESAGAISLGQILAMPQSKGLLSQAVLQSGIALLDPPTLEMQEAVGIELAARTSAPEDASADALRAVPADEWLTAQGERSGGSYGPFIDGRLVTEAPWRVFGAGKALDVPVMIGANSNEASVMLAMGTPLKAAWLFAGTDIELISEAYGGTPEDDEIARQILGDAWFVAPARWMAAQTASGAPSFHYHFDYVASARRNQARGAAHGGEIAYLFGTLDYLGSLTSPPSEEDRQFSAGMSECWIAFARTGVPDCALVPGWSSFDPSTDVTAVLAPDARLVKDYRKAQATLLLERHFSKNGAK